MASHDLVNKNQQLVSSAILKESRVEVDVARDVSTLRNQRPFVDKAGS